MYIHTEFNCTQSRLFQNVLCEIQLWTHLRRARPPGIHPQERVVPNLWAEPEKSCPDPPDPRYDSGRLSWSLVFCKTSRCKRVVELRKSTGTSENLQEKAVLQIFHGEQTWSCPQISSRFTAFPTRHGSMFSVRTQLNNDLTQSYLIS